MTERRPPPSLEELVAKHGGYDRVPPEAWAEHEAAMIEWRDHVRTTKPLRREYDPVKGECQCGAGNGLQHEFLEMAKRDGSYGGTFVLVCTECGGRAQPNAEQALRESGVAEETIEQILHTGGGLP